MSLINAIIFVRVQDAFLYILYYGLLKKMLQLQSSIWKDNDTYLRSFDPFSFSLFAVEQVTDVKKSSILDFFIPNQSRTKGCNLALLVVHVLRDVKTGFIFVKSIFIQFCNAKSRLWDKHAEWPMTDCFLKYLASSLLKLTVAKSSSDFSFKICHELWIFWNAWYTFYTISVWKLSDGR